MPDMKLLWDIQVLDMHRRILEERLKDQSVPEELRNLKTSIELAQDDLREAREEYGRLKKEVRIFGEEDLKIREQIAQIEQQLYSGLHSNPQEMANTVQRVNKLKENMKKLEDRQMSLMEVMGRIYRKIDDQGACLARHKEKYRRLQGTYQMNVENIRKALSQIPLARQRMIDSVDSNLWKRYVQLKTRFRDPIGKVEKGVCTGCGMAVSFNDLKRLKMSEGVVYCVNCGRLLYWQRLERKN